MGKLKMIITICSVVLFAAVTSTLAQQMPNPYGPNINLATAKKIAASAAEEAAKLKINVVIAVVDTSGHTVYLERFDGVQLGSIKVAQHKAKCAVQFKRPTKAMEDYVSKGNIGYLTLDGICAIDGGEPIIQDGKIIGAIGVSGGTSAQDGEVARAAAGLVK